MDLRIRAISEKHNFKIFIVELTDVMKEISKMQETNPLATVVLAKVTTANTLLGIDLKSGELMSSNITTSDGVVGKIIAEFQNNKIRSYIQNPDFDATELMKSKKNPYTLALGQKGTLTVTRHLRGYEPYVSRVDLVDGGIDSDFMNYANTSNQIKTLIATRVELDANFQLKKVVGFMVQLFPEHTEEDIAYLDQKIVNSQKICEKLAQTNSENFEDIIFDLASDAIIVEKPAKLEFECGCNHGKTLTAIKLLGQEEIKKMISENQPVDVICDFCKKKYNISVDELKDLLN